MLRGIFELGTGRTSGFARFRVSPRDFRISVWVLLAVPILLSVILAGRDGVTSGLAILAAVLCALLTPPVVSHALAQLWQREEYWLRFAICFNWARLALTVVYAVLLMIASLLIAGGQPARGVAGIIQPVMVGYTLWLDWFLVRHGLQVSAWRAVFGVLAMNVATFVTVFGPLLITGALTGASRFD
jgi:hypothetical protein